jgi:Kef-type K+ transport system membrane component KefB
VAFAAPLAFALFPRLRVPEILLGIAIGPDGLGWVRADLPISVLSLIGLAFLLFLAGLETDLTRLRGRTVRLATLAFSLSLLLAVVCAVAFSAGSLAGSPLFVAIVLCSTSLGVTFPVLKESGTLRSPFGQLVVAAATIAEFGAFILLVLFSSTRSSSGPAARVVLLAAFALVVALVALAVAGVERSGRISAALVRLQDTTAQIRVRGAFVLLIGFVALAQGTGLETILGAFAAGAVLSVIDRDEAMTHPQFRLKLEAAGFGLFIPVFFVASGLTFDLHGSAGRARPPGRAVRRSARARAQRRGRAAAGDFAALHRRLEPDR